MIIPSFPDDCTDAQRILDDMYRTFTPAIDLSKLPGQSSPTDDLERDHVLSQRIRLFSWVRPCHLDLPFPSTSESASPSSSPELPSTATMERPLSAVETRAKHKERHAQGFIDFAIRELNKINQYKAPRDKLICVLNSCKVIFGQLSLFHTLLMVLALIAIAE